MSDPGWQSSYNWKKRNPDKVREQQRRWKKRHPETVKRLNKKWQKQQKVLTAAIEHETQVRLAVLKEDRGCRLCGERDYRCLSFHHRDPREKFRNVSQMLSYSWKRVQEEIDKCDVVCENCHRKCHAVRCIP